MTATPATATTTTKRPRRARRRKAKAAAIVLVNRTMTTKREKPSVELLSNEVIRKDISNRWLLIKYELAELKDDLIKLFNWAKSSINNIIDRLKTVEL